MATYRGLRPRILWGATYQNELLVGYPFDACVTWPEPREGSEQVMGPSGVEDAWTVATDYFLKGVWRWIPRTRTTNPYATGWNDTNGVRDFLTWARDKNPIRFYPDGRNLVASPALAVDSDADGVVDNFAASHDAALTTSFAVASDGQPQPTTCQKIAVTAAAGNGGALVYQFVKNIQPGDVISCSVDCLIAAMAGSAQVECYLTFRDAGGASLVTYNPGFSGVNAPNYTRIQNVNRVAPANTVDLRIMLFVRIMAAGATLTSFWKNLTIVRGPTSAAFIDNPYKPCYLVEPMKGDPPLEADLTRQLPVTLRAADGTAFDGY